MSTGKALETKQAKAIQALTVAKTVQDAASLAGVSYATLRRWMRDTGFTSSLRQAEQEQLKELRLRTMALQTAALDTVEAICRNGQSEMARLAAARTILQTFANMNEADLYDRVYALEERVNNGTSNQTTHP